MLDKGIERLKQNISHMFKDVVFPEPQEGDDGATSPVVIPVACSILTEQGAIFGARVENHANKKNADGGSAIAEALNRVEEGKTLMGQDFRIAMLAVSSKDLQPIDWDYFGLEKRLLQEQGITKIVYVCPDNGQHRVCELN